MELLYKYYSDESSYAFDNLENGTVSFCSIDTLNDPFEGIGTLLFQASDDEQEFWGKMGVSNFSKFMGDLIVDGGYERITFYYRVFCASKDYDNPLLWAYYANSHKGFCVGYDKSIISNVSDELFDIDYRDTMHQFKEFDEKNCKKLLSIKSEAWKKENECRALYVIKDNDISHIHQEYHFGEKHSDGKLYRSNIFNDPLNDRIIKETLCSNKYISVKCPAKVIYLGLRTNANVRDQLIDLAQKHRIKIYQMTQDKNSFGFLPLEV